MKRREAPSLAGRLARLTPEQRTRAMARLGRAELDSLSHCWSLWERDDQRQPALPWRTWLILAGRGFGKTRMGAEWVRRIAATDPTARIALVGANEGEARRVMVEGDSGILAVCAKWERPEWQPSRRLLSWPNGAKAFVYSAAEPESLRGPQHHYAWCDEIAKWPFGVAAWDNLMFGLRLGALPRAVATTTPRPVALVRRLCGKPGVARTRGRTYDNAANLAASFIAEVRRDYGGTRLGRQELDGELIEDVEGSLWPRELIEKCRVNPSPCRGEGKLAAGERGEGKADEDRPSPSHSLRERAPPSPLQGEGFRRIVVGVDPPVSAEGDSCGIVVCGLADGVGFVLEDATVWGLRPEGWARVVEKAAERWSADRVVAEGNQGGQMVESVLRGADINLPISIVYARWGKSTRAEPVAALFERGAAKFAGAFPELEDELAGMTVGGGYEGPGRSPDRADAMVWAMTELMLGKRRAMPRITQL
ncbi:MAG: DNA-packaging protein [Allosphingosinicella sp.]